MVLQVAPGAVAFITGAREIEGEGTELEGGTKTGDGIAFLFRGRRGGCGRRVARFAVAPSYRAPSLPPSDGGNVPAGEMGRDHKNPRASLFATDVYRAVP